MAIEIEYREVTIRFSEYSEKWICGEWSHGSLKTLKKMIDKSINTQVKGQEAYLLGDWSSIEIVTLTSGAGEKFWVRHADGKRSYVRLSELKAITPENDEIVQNIINSIKEQKALDQREQSLRQALAPFVPASAKAEG